MSPNINVVDRGSDQQPAARNRPNSSRRLRMPCANGRMQRLQAVGSDGRSDLTSSSEANVATQPLSKNSGMSTWFERQQGSKYVGHAEVEIRSAGP